MKLVDIKKSVENSVTAEFKHALYSACAVLSRSVIETIFETECNMIYESESFEDIPE